MKAIKTKRFTIREFQRGDEDSLHINLNNENILRNTVRLPNPYTLGDAHEWVQFNMELSKKEGRKDINLAIEINGEVVGGIGLNDINGHKAEIGYWIAEQCWNKGIMTEAVIRLTKFGRQQLKLKRIYAIVFTFNTSSTKVLEKAEYKLEGKLENYTQKNDKLHDVFMYAHTA